MYQIRKTSKTKTKYKFKNLIVFITRLLNKKYFKKDQNNALCV